MTKAPMAFRTISEVSETLDVPQHVLRFWEGKFPHIKPLKRAGGRRYYRPEDIELLRGIRALLYAEGYTIKGVQKVLRTSGVRHVCDLGRYGVERPARGVAEGAPPFADEDPDAGFAETEGAEAADFDEDGQTGADEPAASDARALPNGIEPSADSRVRLGSQRPGRRDALRHAGESTFPHTALAQRQDQLEAALNELLALRDLLKAARPKRSDAA